MTLQSGVISSLFRLFSGKSFFSSGVNLNKSNAFLISLNASEKIKLIINMSHKFLLLKKNWVSIKKIGIFLIFTTTSLVIKPDQIYYHSHEVVSVGLWLLSI